MKKPVHVAPEVVHRQPEALQPMVAVGVIACIALFVRLSVRYDDRGFPSPSPADVGTQRNGSVVTRLEVRLVLQPVLAYLKLYVRIRRIVVRAFLAVPHAPRAYLLRKQMKYADRAVSQTTDHIVNRLVYVRSVPVIAVLVPPDL